VQIEKEREEIEKSEEKAAQMTDRDELRKFSMLSDYR
jgi:hypothetical protein